jgi:hypothetical protein
MKATETGRDSQGCIGNDAASSMSFVQARTVAGGVPIKGAGVPITLIDGKSRNILAKQLHQGTTAKGFH